MDERVPEHQDEETEIPDEDPDSAAKLQRILTEHDHTPATTKDQAHKDCKKLDGSKDCSQTCKDVKKIRSIPAM
jgi:hypothetical protein